MNAYTDAQAVQVRDFTIRPTFVIQFVRVVGPLVRLADATVLDVDSAHDPAVIRKVGEAPPRTAFHRDGHVFGRRGARIARRQEGACRVPVTNEPPSEAGCPDGRDATVMVKRGTKGFPRSATL